MFSLGLLGGSWYLLAKYNCTKKTLLIITLKGLMGVVPAISRVISPVISGY